MRLWIELSGEHPTLPRAEALAAFEAEGVAIRSVSWAGPLLRLDCAGPVERAWRRLGLAHLVCEELAHGSLQGIREYAKAIELGGRTFRVRARSLGPDMDVRGIEATLGADLAITGRVNLDHPEWDLRLLLADEFLLGRVVHRVDRPGLEARKVAYRPFSLPISLHPKFARALVNLSRVPTGGRLGDPFCGTGGILLEASLLGLRAVGSDTRRSMVLGARESLRRFEAAADLHVGDAGHLPWKAGRIQGIATDPPYGRAASTRGEPLPRLYKRAFAAFAEVLPRDGRAAVILPSEEAIRLAETHLEAEEHHALRVHRSLTRHFCVFVKSPGG